MDDVRVVLFNEELDILCYVTRGHASPNKDITEHYTQRLNFEYLQLVRRADSCSWLLQNDLICLLK